MSPPLGRRAGPARWFVVWCLVIGALLVLVAGAVGRHDDAPVWVTERGPSAPADWADGLHIGATPPGFVVTNGCYGAMDSLPDVTGLGTGQVVAYGATPSRDGGAA